MNEWMEANMQKKRKKEEKRWDAEHEGEDGIIYK